MSKRANGEGSLWFDESKQIYRAAITMPSGKRATKASKSEDVVKDWLNEQRLLIGRGQHVEPHGLTLGLWIDEWLEVYAKATVRPRTYDRYVSLLAHTKPIQKVLLVKLLPSHFQKLYNNMAEYAGNTRKHLHYCLSGCLKQAVKNNLIHNNPIEAVDCPKAKQKEIEIFTDEELARIFKACENTKYPVLIYLAYRTGMRISEILALKWENVNFKKNTISIKQTVHYSSSAGTHLCEPKTAQSMRTIKVDADLILKLKEHKLRSGDGAILFPANHGGLLNPTTYLRYHWAVIREKAEVTKGFHSFRHTHATQLIAAGVPPQDVARRLGHSRVSTTMNIYTHADESGEDAIIDIIDTFSNRIKAQAQNKKTGNTP